MNVNNLLKLEVMINNHFSRCVLYGSPLIINLEMVVKIIMSFSDQSNIKNILPLGNIVFVIVFLGFGLIGFVQIIRSSLLMSNRSQPYDYILLSIFLSFVLFPLLLPFTIAVVVFSCRSLLILSHRSAHGSE